MDGLIAAFVGLVGGVLLTPLVRTIALRLDIVDRPGELKTQRAPVAYLGGVAVFLAMLIGPLISQRAWVLLPMVLALGLGLADDVRPLAVPLRVGVEIGIATLAAIVVPGTGLTRFATAVLVLGLLNAVNLLDGQDGLAAGVGVVISVGFSFLGGPATAVGLGLAGALLGFLVLNRPPARIYLGDAGAYLVGTTIALLPALSRHSTMNWSLWWAVPLLVAMPIADTTIAIARRLRARRPLLSGDRSHVYDQLVDRGMSVGQSTVLCVGAQLVFTTFGVVTTEASPVAALAVTALVGLVSAFVAWRTGLLTVARE